MKAAPGFRNLAQTTGATLPLYDGNGFFKVCCPVNGRIESFDSTSVPARNLPICLKQAAWSITMVMMMTSTSRDLWTANPCLTLLYLSTLSTQGTLPWGTLTLLEP